MCLRKVMVSHTCGYRGSYFWSKDPENRSIRKTHQIRPTHTPYKLRFIKPIYVLPARRVERAIAGLWAMRGSKRRNTGGGSGPPPYP